MKHFEMAKIEDQPKLISPATEMATDDGKREFLHQHVGEIVDKFIFNRMGQTLDNIEQNV